LNRLSLTLVCLTVGCIAGYFWKGREMSQLHDDLLAKAKSVKDSAQKAAAVGTEQQQQMTDVYNLLDEATKILEDFIKDNAASGSSTGGGSGAQTEPVQPQQQTASQQGWKA
jgi:hypothetical protein